MPVDTSEKGLEDIITGYLVTHNGYEQGYSSDYNKDCAVDEPKLFSFLQATQKAKLESSGLLDDTRKKARFLERVRDEITARGIVDVLRNGIQTLQMGGTVNLYYMLPSDLNEDAKALYGKNVYSVTRQLHYSNENNLLALDVCIFINGLPVLTCELKNSFTGQHTADAVEQYKSDRSERDLLFKFKRCMAHFAVDDDTIMFCTKLAGNASWFLPFNKGTPDGSAGNPPAPDGIKTDYFWKYILEKTELSNIIENYAQVVKEEDPEHKGKFSYKQIFPRYHQLAAVEAVLADVKENGIGRRYLIQHSAGSGKSNSIAWIAHQLSSMQIKGKDAIDSVIVVTDRRNLDRQIRENVRKFSQSKNIVGAAFSSKDLRENIQNGKRIIITTVQKFPFILDSIGDNHKDKKFGIIIDEAHSSQSGRMSAEMNMALAGISSDAEDDINKIIEERMQKHRMLSNASYFAFTATPKNKTLEMFGVPYGKEDGKTGYRPFHNYSMKQAVQEGFILDVLRNYIPYKSYYKLSKKATDNPEFRESKALKKLNAFVESNILTIQKKSEIIVADFINNVCAKQLLKGRSRAMVVTGSIMNAIEYYYAIKDELVKQHSTVIPVVAFSGSKEYGGAEVTESSINGFPSNQIEENMKKDPYRILVAADKFQTGYDEPLMQTMYVDKILDDIQAVQTLSRLNRAYPGKKETRVIDFINDPDNIKKSFEPYYKTTLLSDKTDPDKLFDLQNHLAEKSVYTEEDIETVVGKFLTNARREDLDFTLDTCVGHFNALEENDKIAFKSDAKQFVRMYGFLSAILPCGQNSWEKLQIFLTLLLPKLPKIRKDDDLEGLLDAVDFTTYQNEQKEQRAIELADSDQEIDPIQTRDPNKRGEEEPKQKLTKILTDFNKSHWDAGFVYKDRMKKDIEEMPVLVTKDDKYMNAMKQGDKDNARKEFDDALMRVILNLMKDNMELYKQYSDNADFRKWLSDGMFTVTYNGEGKPFKG